MADAVDIDAGDVPLAVSERARYFGNALLQIGRLCVDFSRAGERLISCRKRSFSPGESRQSPTTKRARTFLLSDSASVSPETSLLEKESEFSLKNCDPSHEESPGSLVADNTKADSAPDFESDIGRNALIGTHKTSSEEVKTKKDGRQCTQVPQSAVKPEDEVGSGSEAIEAMLIASGSEKEEEDVQRGHGEVRVLEMTGRGADESRKLPIREPISEPRALEMGGYTATETDAVDMESELEEDVLKTLDARALESVGTAILETITQNSDRTADFIVENIPRDLRMDASIEQLRAVFDRMEQSHGIARSFTNKGFLVLDEAVARAAAVHGPNARRALDAKALLADSDIPPTEEQEGSLVHSQKAGHHASRAAVAETAAEPETQANGDGDAQEDIQEGLEDTSTEIRSRRGEETPSSPQPQTSVELQAEINDENDMEIDLLEEPTEIVGPKRNNKGEGKPRTSVSPAFTGPEACTIDAEAQDKLSRSDKGSKTQDGTLKSLDTATLKAIRTWIADFVVKIPDRGADIILQSIPKMLYLKTSKNQRSAILNHMVEAQQICRTEQGFVAMNNETPNVPAVTDKSANPTLEVVSSQSDVRTAVRGSPTKTSLERLGKEGILQLATTIVMNVAKHHDKGLKRITKMILSNKRGSRSSSDIRDIFYRMKGAGGIVKSSFKNGFIVSDKEVCLAAAVHGIDDNGNVKADNKQLAAAAISPSVRASMKKQSSSPRHSRRAKLVSSDDKVHLADPITSVLKGDDGMSAFISPPPVTGSPFKIVATSALKNTSDHPTRTPLRPSFPKVGEHAAFSPDLTESNAKEANGLAGLKSLDVLPGSSSSTASALHTERPSPVAQKSVSDKPSVKEKQGIHPVASEKKDVDNEVGDDGDNESFVSAALSVNTDDVDETPCAAHVAGGTVDLQSLNAHRLSTPRSPPRTRIHPVPFDNHNSSAKASGGRGETTQASSAPEPRPPNVVDQGPENHGQASLFGKEPNGIPGLSLFSPKGRSKLKKAGMPPKRSPRHADYAPEGTAMPVTQGGRFVEEQQNGALQIGREDPGEVQSIALQRDAYATVEEFILDGSSLRPIRATPEVLDQELQMHEKPSPKKSASTGRTPSRLKLRRGVSKVRKSPCTVSSTEAEKLILTLLTKFPHLSKEDVFREAQKTGMRGISWKQYEQGYKTVVKQVSRKTRDAADSGKNAESPSQPNSKVSAVQRSANGPVYYIDRSGANRSAGENEPLKQGRVINSQNSAVPVPLLGEGPELESNHGAARANCSAAIRSPVFADRKGGTNYSPEKKERSKERCSPKDNCSTRPDPPPGKEHGVKNGGEAECNRGEARTNWPSNQECLFFIDRKGRNHSDCEKEAEQGRGMDDKGSVLPVPVPGKEDSVKNEGKWKSIGEEAETNWWVNAGFFFGSDENGEEVNSTEKVSPVDKCFETSEVEHPILAKEWTRVSPRHDMDSDGGRGDDPGEKQGTHGSEINQDEIEVEQSVIPGNLARVGSRGKRYKKKGMGRRDGVTAEGKRGPGHGLPNAGEKDIFFMYGAEAVHSTPSGGKPGSRVSTPKGTWLRKRFREVPDGAGSLTRRPHTVGRCVE